MIQFIVIPKLGDLIVFHLLRGEMVVVKAAAADAIRAILEQRDQNRPMHAWDAAFALPPELATQFTREEVENLTKVLSRDVLIGHPSGWAGQQRALKAEALYRAEEPDPAPAPSGSPTPDPDPQP